MRILIIEDDRQLNNIISKHLREAGYAVDCCFDGDDGLYYMESAEYDCVILDWMLPKKDGPSVLRRRGEVRQSVLSLADLSMDTAAHTVTRAGRRITLTSREYALLEYLLRNQGIIQTRSQISDHVWNYDFEYDSNVVDVYVRYLRNKIDRGFDRPLIHTIRGFGYVMRLEDEKA